MPLDPNIPLSYRSPQPASSPLEMYGQALQLRDLMDSRRLRQYQLEQAKRATADEEAARQLFAQNPNPTEQEIYSTIGPAAGAPIIEGQRKARRADLDAQEAQLKLAAQQTARLGQLAGAVRDQTSYESAIRQAIGEGLIRPEALSRLPAAWSPQVSQTLQTQALTVQQQIEQGWKALENARAEETQRFAAERAAHEQELRPLQIAKATAESEAAQQAVEGTQPMTPYQRAQTDRASMPNTPAELAIVANDPARSPGERERAGAALRTLERHAIASRPVTTINSLPALPGVAGSGRTNLTGEDFLRTLPTGLAAEIKGMADGRLTAPSASNRSPIAQQKLTLLMQYDPSFTVQRAQLRKAFTTGADGRNIGALNTAVVHLGRLGETARALRTGTFVPGNELYNWIKDRFGSAAVTNFELLKDAVAGEMAAALKGNATDIEIANMKRSIRAANSPDQMEGVVQEGMGILLDKANTYEQRYRALMPDDPWSPVLPAAKEMLERHGIKAAGQGAPARQGVIVQHSPSTGQYRHSRDGGKTWLPGKP